MRKIFTLFTMCMLAAVAWAADITFDPAVDKGNAGEQASAYEVPKDGVIISVSNGLIAADKGVWAYRVYKGQTMTISCESSDITQIEFECAANGEEKYGPGCFTAEAGKGTYTFEPNGPKGTWTGSVRSITFTATSNQVRATKIIVTVGKAGLSAPVITPEGGTYYDPINVNITCGTSGAKIYYTTDGSTPSTSSTQFTAPFTVSTATTVKAISARDNEVSEVVEAAYTFGTATPVPNIKAYQQVADNTVVKFSNPVIVTAQSGNRMYVKDASGYALVYGKTNQTYATGDNIPAGFVGTKITYSGEPELSDPVNFMPSTVNTPTEPEVLTCSQVNASKFAHYAVFNEAQFDLDRMVIMDATGEAPLYFNMNVKKSDVKSGVKYNVVAVIASFAREGEPVVYQVIPVSVSSGEKMGLGLLSEVADGQIVKLEYDATVIWQGGRNNAYLYVADETGFGLIYGDVGHVYFIGDVLKKDYTAKKTTYPTQAPNEPELATPFTGFDEPINVDENFRLNPEEISPAQVDHDHWAHYVVLKNVTISSDGGTISRDGESCQMYNATFNVPLPDDLNATHTVYGIVGVYKNYQVLPLSFDKAPERPAPTPPIDVENLEEFYTQVDGNVKGHFTTPLTAVYQSKEADYLYVQDVEGEFGLIYGDLDVYDFPNGTQLHDVTGTKGTYQGAPQINPKDNSVVPAEMGTPVNPRELAMEEISQDMVHTYFYFPEVTVTVGDKIIITDETEELQLFDKFKLEPVVEEGKKYEVWGFLGLFQGAMQILPIKVKEIGGGDDYLPEDVNMDGEVSVADVNIIIDIILGFNYPDKIRERADVNGDKEISIADINRVINKILGL